MNTSDQTLAALQHWLQAVITHPAGVARGIESPEAQALLAVGVDEIESVIPPSRSLTSQQRLAVYGNAYFARLLECLREMFPALRYALEADVFDQFAIGYLTTHPPRSYTLDRLSDRFIDFLRDTRGQLADTEATWPDFVIDLARLEYTIERVFDGPGVERSSTLSADDLQRIDPAKWPQAALQPAPCLRLLAFRFPVNDYFSAWRAIDANHNARLPLPDPQENYLALTRKNYVVQRYAMTRPQYDLLSAIVAGATVGESIAAAAERCDDPDRFAADLGRWFQSWTAAEFFVSVRMEK